jgi:hypothetical protein
MPFPNSVLFVQGLLPNPTRKLECIFCESSNVYANLKQQDRMFDRRSCRFKSGTIPLLPLIGGGRKLGLDVPIFL